MLDVLKLFAILVGILVAGRLMNKWYPAEEGDSWRE